MEVGVKDLRDHLSRYLDAVRNGAEVTVTDHGKAVARITGLGERKLDRLIAQGLVTPARTSKRPWTGPVVTKPAGTVSDLVIDDRGPA
jgi:prevent-host-death family protein